MYLYGPNPCSLTVRSVAHSAEVGLGCLSFVKKHFPMGTLREVNVKGFDPLPEQSVEAALPIARQALSETANCSTQRERTL